MTETILKKAPLSPEASAATADQPTAAQQTPAYNKGFYQGQQNGSLRSAHQIVPLVLQWLKPQEAHETQEASINSPHGIHSVVDVGCGLGTWLSVFSQHGVADIQGFDGSYVDPNMLLIPQTFFTPHDLTRPIRAERTYDLVVSLEVAEHLPAPFAQQFVESLTSLGSVVLFSAAIPFQGGTHHVNEQWPAYWAELFATQGYVPVDCLRQTIWNDPDIDWCYAQNMLFYVRQDQLEQGRYPKLQAFWQAAGSPKVPQALVHPRKFLEQTDPAHMTLRCLAGWLPTLLAGFPTIVLNALKRRVKF